MASNSGNTRKTSEGQRKKSAPAKSTAAKNSSSAKGKAQASVTPRPIRREIGAVVCAFLAIFAFLGLFNIEALFINALGGLFKGLFGWGFYVLPFVLLLCAVILGFHRGRPVILRTVTALLIPVVIGAMGHMLFCRIEYDFAGKFLSLVQNLFADGKALTSGGLLCGLIALGLEAMFSIYGAFPVLVALLIFFVLSSANLRLSQIIGWFRNRERRVYIPEPEPEFAVDEPVRKRIPGGAKNAAKPDIRDAIDIPLDEDTAEEEYIEERVGFFNKRSRVKTPDQVLADKQETEAEKQLEKDEKAFESAPEKVFTPPPQPETPVISEPEGIFTTEEQRAKEKAGKRELAAVRDEVVQEIEKAMEVTPAYQFPPIDLLRRGHASAVDGREEIALNRERLETTIKSFGVSATIVGVTRGPTVTRYDLELDVGVKLNKLLNLAGDLALSLGVTSVRIAPIPDKISTVGVEVPNKLVSIVYLRDIIESANFKNAASNLTFAIGKDIGGDSIVGNISKLPHMLIAGTTGSGKSVCLNSLLLSLLYKSSPDNVRMIMIDPKMVELGIYNGIPHLFVPVVTDPKKAAGALQWAVVEMLKRYRLFSDVGVRDLTGYNAHQKKIGENTLPQIVIVVDELADLMLVASKEVEESICRVAQMGRASGMHLIIATQRPSADVITGLMKANIPSRIAFAVSSALESRIILDTQGAEKLVGMGDMLYFPLGSGKPMRVQGAYVSDEEREDVISFIKQSSETEYSDEILAQIEKAAEGKGGNGGVAGLSADEAPPAKSEYDDLLPQAVEVLLETKQASVSMLQRRLKLGYSRAARLVDQMEELGIVGPFEGSKPRQLLITRQQWQEMQLVQGTAPTEQLAPDFAYEDNGEELE